MGQDAKCLDDSSPGGLKRFARTHNSSNLLSRSSVCIQHVMFTFKERGTG